MLKASILRWEVVSSNDNQWGICFAPAFGDTFPRRNAFILASASRSDVERQNLIGHSQDHPLELPTAHGALGARDNSETVRRPAPKLAKQASSSCPSSGFSNGKLVAMVAGNSAPWAKELPSPTSHSNRSLRTEVSVAGKRNFQGRDKEAETALEIKDTGAETKSR